MKSHRTLTKGPLNLKDSKPDQKTFYDACAKTLRNPGKYLKYPCSNPCNLREIFQELMQPP